MSTKNEKKRLVIDTNIASSASETTNPTSINCRKTLDTILEQEFFLVFTPELLVEWNKHRSRYFNTWLRKMFARRLQVQLKDEDVHNKKLREDISKFAQSEKEKAKGESEKIKAENDEREMLKDVLLLEAALATDKTILSMNVLDKKRFKAACKEIKIIREIVWVNPSPSEGQPDEKCILWLCEGAPPDEKRCLGYQDKEN